MPNYKTLYLMLFNRITDAIELLKKAQQEAEDRFLEDSETEDDEENDNEDNSERE
ncbi:MAG: hypothetical protein LBN02_02555 [Oscillospiraceae bacterium]|jgi:hypothetical protein|nr:hypothetical protein [Oscillospiraceae bacterium]